MAELIRQPEGCQQNLAPTGLSTPRYQRRPLLAPQSALPFVDCALLLRLCMSILLPLRWISLSTSAPITVICSAARQKFQWCSEQKAASADVLLPIIQSPWRHG